LNYTGLAVGARGTNDSRVFPRRDSPQRLIAAAGPVTAQASRRPSDLRSFEAAGQPPGMTPFGPFAAIRVPRKQTSPTSLRLPLLGIAGARWSSIWPNATDAPLPTKDRSRLAAAVANRSCIYSVCDDPARKFQFRPYTFASHLHRIFRTIRLDVLSASLFRCVFRHERAIASACKPSLL
jgi:hypothetical protein